MLLKLLQSSQPIPLRSSLRVYQSRKSLLSCATHKDYFVIVKNTEDRTDIRHTNNEAAVSNSSELIWHLFLPLLDFPLCAFALDRHCKQDLSFLLEEYREDGKQDAACELLCTENDWLTFGCMHVVCIYITVNSFWKIIGEGGIRRLEERERGREGEEQYPKILSSLHKPSYRLTGR